MAGNEEEDKGRGEGKKTGCNLSFNTAISNSGTQGSMAGLIFVPNPSVRSQPSCWTACTECKKKLECPRKYISSFVVCPYCNGTFLVSEIMKASPPNNIPFDYGGNSSFCSPAAMPSVPMGFQAATEVQPERQDALQLEQTSVHHAANDIPFDSTPQFLQEERLAGPISTSSFQGHPERMTDSDIFRDYECAALNPIIFYQILITLLTQQRKIFLIPQFQGAPLDLHRIFVEVTSRGGICKVTRYGRLGEVCAALPQNIGDQNLYDIYDLMLYACEVHLCNFPYENHLRPNHSSISSAGERPMPGVLGGQPSLVHMQTIFSGNGKQPQQSICMNPCQRLPASSLPLPGIQNFAPPQRKLDTSSHQTLAQYLTGHPQKFTSSAVRSLYPSRVPNEGQVRPVRPQREAQVVSLQKREVPAPNSTCLHGRNRNPGVAVPSRNMQPIASPHFGHYAMPTPEQSTLGSSLTPEEYQAAASRQGITMTPSLCQGSSSTRLAPCQYLPSRANYAAAEQLNNTPYVPAPILSAEQVSLQREVGAIATEAQDANVKRKEFPCSDWSLNAIPGSACLPSAPEPSSLSTLVSAQTVGQTTQTLAEAPVPVMRTTDSLPREDPAYSPVLHKWKIAPEESIDSSDLSPILGELEAINNEPPFITKLNSDQQDNQMKADETKAGAKDNYDDWGSKKRKGNQRQSRR